MCRMRVATFFVVFVTSLLYLPCREYSVGCRWSSFKHRWMSNATLPASKDLFSIVPWNSDWQWTVELLAIRLGAPLSTVSQNRKSWKHCLHWPVVWHFSHTAVLAYAIVHCTTSLCSSQSCTVLYCSAEIDTSDDYLKAEHCGGRSAGIRGT